MQNQLVALLKAVTSNLTLDDIEQKMRIAGWSNAQILHRLDFLKAIDKQGMGYVYAQNNQRYHRYSRSLGSLGIPLLVEQDIGPIEIINPIPFKDKFAA